jgi:tetratricopeptide (TPR) repeat protein
VRKTPRTVASRNQLAKALRQVGSFVEAEALDGPDFEQRRGDHGNTHTRTVRAAFVLAEDYYWLGRYHDCLQLMNQFGSIGRSLLGIPDVGVIVANRFAGLAKRRLGQVDGAVEDLRQVYNQCVDTFEPNHDLLLAVTVSYANALRQAGTVSQAEHLTSEAVAIYQGMFTSRHPLTLAAEVNRGAIQRARGRWAAARATDIRATEELRAVVGEAHPYAVAAAVNYATDLSLAGDHDGALAISRRVYAVAVEARGPKHPDALIAGANLALDLQATGATAINLREEVLHGWQELMGDAHPAVADVARGVRVECDIEPFTI